jgi:putative ABC transport system substrate-binding protein
LVGLQADIILVSSTAATAALQRETRTIPIVFATVADPVALSIVERLDRPSGNITGFASYEATLAGKWLELLSEIAPGAQAGRNHVQSRYRRQRFCLDKGNI